MLARQGGFWCPPWAANAPPPLRAADRYLFLWLMGMNGQELDADLDETFVDPVWSSFAEVSLEKEAKVKSETFFPLRICLINY